MKIQEGIITFIPGCLLNLLPQPFLKWKVVKQHMFRWGWQRSQRSCAEGWAEVRHSATNMLGSGRKPWRNGKSFRKITLENYPWRMVLSPFMCVFSVTMNYLNAGGDWLLNHGHHWGNGCVWRNWRCAVHKTIMGQSVSPVLFLGWETRWDKMTVVCTII